MQDLQVKIEPFEGPLDLLLALITRHKLDIFDIPIATVAEQYTEYLESMRRMDMEIAGEFLVMAAELMLIKSRMLLPQKEGEADPRKLLVDALLEHKRAEMTAQLLRERADQFYDRFPKPAEEQTDLTYRRAHAVALLTEAFERMNERLELRQAQKAEVKLFRDLREERYYTVEEKMDVLFGTLRTNGKVRFESLFEGAHSRGEAVAIFLSVLEAVRFGQVDVERATPFEDGGDGTLWLSLSADFSGIAPSEEI